jgi:hypothetical protein
MRGLVDYLHHSKLMPHPASVKRKGSVGGTARKKSAPVNSSLIEVLRSGDDRFGRHLTQSAAVQSTILPAVLPTRLMLSDIVPIIGIPAAPWVSLMEYVIPFSDNVFVAGSAATWLAGIGVHRLRPQWEPTDIDVFMIHTEPLEFAARVDAAIAELKSWSEDNWPVRSRMYRKHPHIVNIDWWISDVQCPTLSFINCIRDVDSSDDVLNGFDIDICRVTINKVAGEMCVNLNSAVRRNIQNHVMHCVLKQGSLLSEIHYPMSRSIDRIEKYSERGYRLQSLTFESDSQIRIDKIVKAVSWDVLGKSSAVDDPSHPCPPPQPYEWQSRGSLHNHMLLGDGKVNAIDIPDFFTANVDHVDNE